MIRKLALAALLAALPSQAADFPSIGDLAQGEFRELSRDLGSAFSYKGVTPATPLGPLGLDVGIEVTDTRIENSSLFARAGAGSRSHLVVPKVHVHKGFLFGIDVSAFAAGAPDVSATIFGAGLRWAMVDDGLATPAVGLRISGSRATGLGDLKIGTGGLDLVVSKKFTAITPYVGAGVVRIQTSASNTGLNEERIDEKRVFGGLNVNLLAANFAFEAEKMGDNVSLSAKLGWRF